MAELPNPLKPSPQLPLCVCVPKPIEPICITLPFGIQVCTNRYSVFKFESLDTTLFSFLANLQPLMAGLMPILVLISLVKALIDCVNAIADAVSQLSPGPIYDCLEKLARLFPSLFQFIPPFNYLEFINTLIHFLISLLDALIDALNAALSLNIDAAVALLPDDDRLRCCLDANLRAQLEQLEAAMHISGPVFLVLAQILSILEVPGLKPFIEPVRKGAEALGTARVDADTISIIGDLRDALVKVADIVAAVGANPLVQIIQGANNCEC